MTEESKVEKTTSRKKQKENERKCLKDYITRKIIVGVLCLKVKYEGKLEGLECLNKSYSNIN